MYILDKNYNFLVEVILIFFIFFIPSTFSSVFSCFFCAGRATTPEKEQRRRTAASDPRRVRFLVCLLLVILISFSTCLVLKSVQKFHLIKISGCEVGVLASAPIDAHGCCEGEMENLCPPPTIKIIFEISKILNNHYYYFIVNFNFINSHLLSFN